MDAATQRVFFSSDALTFFSEHMGVQGLRSAACKLGQKRYAFLRKKKERPRKHSNAENVGNVLSIGIDSGVVRGALRSGGSGVTASTMNDKGVLERAVRRAERGCVDLVEDVSIDLGTVVRVSFLQDAHPDKRARKKMDREGGDVAKGKDGVGFVNWTYDVFFPALHKALVLRMADCEFVCGFDVASKDTGEADDLFGGYDLIVTLDSDAFFMARPTATVRFVETLFDRNPFDVSLAPWPASMSSTRPPRSSGPTACRRASGFHSFCVWPTCRRAQRLRGSCCACAPLSAAGTDPGSPAPGRAFALSTYPRASCRRRSRTRRARWTCARSATRSISACGAFCRRGRR